MEVGFEVRVDSLLPGLRFPSSPEVCTASSPSPLLQSSLPPASSLAQVLPHLPGLEVPVFTSPVPLSLPAALRHPAGAERSLSLQEQTGSPGDKFAGGAAGAVLLKAPLRPPHPTPTPSHSLPSCALPAQREALACASPHPPWPMSRCHESPARRRAASRPGAPVASARRAEGQLGGPAPGRAAEGRPGGEMAFPD